MTIWVPGWMQGGTYTAQQDRINSRAADWDEGVKDRLALKVAQRGAGANLSVDVAIGACVVQGDDQANQGNYDVFNDAVFNLTGFVATGANTRYDIVGVQINDPNAGGAAGSNATIVRVAGTQAASPVIPAIPNSFLLLAIIGPFTTSTTAITTAMIHDAFTGTGPTGVTGARLLQGFRDSPGTTKETYNPIAPNGWLIEDGTAISRTTYAALFEHFGVTFGAGNGSTTFNLPDSRGRVLVALDNQGGSDAGRLAAANALGGTGGEELHTQTAAEIANHAHTTPAHFHVADPPAFNWSAWRWANTGQVAAGTYVLLSDIAANGGLPNLSIDIPSFNTNTDGSGVSGSNGLSTPFNVMQPYIFGYRIVRT